MRYISIIIVLLMLSACAARGPSRTARHVEGTRTVESARLEKRLGEFRAATPTLTGLAWVELRTGDEERRTEAALALERPSKIRVDAMDALADVWAQAGSDGKRLWLFIPSKGKLYEGRASSYTLHKLAKFSWEPSELVEIVAGSPPLGSKPDIVQVGPASDGHFVAEGSGLHIWTEGEKGRIAKCVRFAADGVTKDYEILFSDYKRLSGVDFPRKIEATFPGRGARILIDYREVELGGSVKSASFAVPEKRARKSEKVGGE